MRKLNEDFGLRVEKNGRLKNFFTLKIGRKTFGSQVAQEKGVEVASRALNHSDTQVTRDHYIVPEEKDLEFEFEDKKSNVENIDKHRLEKLKSSKVMPITINDMGKLNWNLFVNIYTKLNLRKYQKFC